MTLMELVTVAVSVVISQIVQGNHGRIVSLCACVRIHTCMFSKPLQLVRHPRVWEFSSPLCITKEPVYVTLGMMQRSRVPPEERDGKPLLILILAAATAIFCDPSLVECFESVV